MFDDFLQDAVCILQDVVVPEAQDAVALVLQKCASLLIILLLLIENNISDEDILKIEQGVDIGNYITQPAKVKKISDNKIYLTIKEGKFHQVKKMLEAVNNKVYYLQRVSFGKLKLNDLALGEVKEVNLEDII